MDPAFGLSPFIHLTPSLKLPSFQRLLCTRMVVASPRASSKDTPSNYSPRASTSSPSSPSRRRATTRQQRRRRVAASIAAATRLANEKTAQNERRGGRKGGKGGTAAAVAAAGAPSADVPPPPPSPTTDPDTASGVLDALRELGFSIGDVQRVVRKRPRVLRLDADRHVRATCDFLRQEPLGLSEKQLRSAVSFAPQLFSKEPPEKLFGPRLTFLTNVAHVAPAQLGNAVAKRPHVLWMDLVAAGAVVSAVQSACPLMSPESVGKVFARVPQALVTSPTAISDNIAFVTDTIRSTAAIQRVLGKIPLCLVFSQKTMSVRIDALRALGASDDTIARIVIATPDILQWSVSHKLNPTVARLAELVGADAIPSVLDKLPAILGNVDSFDSRVEWLRETVGLDETEMRSVLRAAPAVLTYSVAGNLSPKWAFVQNTMGGAKGDVVEAPREILCANLQQRAMPRYAFAMSVAPDRAEGMSVPDILRGSDAEFCRNVVHCDPEEYQSFVAEDRFLFFYSHWIL